MKNPVFISIPLLLVLPYYCLAQDVDLEKIVVTPSRVEQACGTASRKVEVITAQDIAYSGANDVSGVLYQEPSVVVNNYGGLGATKTIKMRGSSAAQVLVLQDGRPLNSPRDGEVDLSTIPLEDIERIEVMRGPGSSLYGAGAMGGTINIITKKVPADKPRTEFSSSFGTFRTYDERLLHGARVGKFGYLITGDYERSHGFRDNSEFEGRDLNAKLEYDLNYRNSLTFNTGAYKSESGAPGTLDNFDADDKQHQRKNFFDLTWLFKPDAQSALSTKVYQNYDRLEFIENTAGSIFDTAFSKDIHTTKVKGLDTQYSRQWTDQYLGVYGFNYVSNINDSTTSAKHEYLVRAFYTENQFKATEKLRFNFGARADDYSNFGTEVNPSVGAVYDLNEKLALRGLLSRSFRAPTFNDLYWPDQGWVKGNPNLKPEKGTTGEVGIDLKVTKRLSSSLTYYRSRYDNLINWAEEAGVWMPKNVGSAIIQGVEFQNRICLTERLAAEIDYTFLHPIDQGTKKDLIYQPQHKADLGLKYNDRRGLVLGIRAQFTGTRFHDQDNTIKVKPFYTVGLYGSKKFGTHWTYFASVDNLLNRQYQTVRGYPMPGFSITNGFKVEF